MLGATGVFCIGKDCPLAGTEPNCFLERPGSIGVERDSRLEVLEPVARFGGFGQLQHRLCRERFLMP